MSATDRVEVTAQQDVEGDCSNWRIKTVRVGQVEELRTEERTGLSGREKFLNTTHHTDGTIRVSVCLHAPAVAVLRCSDIPCWVDHLLSDL